MEWTKYQALMVLLLVLSGSLNNFLISWVDGLVSQGVEKKHVYNHFVVRTEVMFIGELLCLVVYFVRQRYQRWRSQSHPSPDQDKEPPKYNPLIFLPASILDMCSSVCLLIGLQMMFDSFPILKASKIIFTLVFSIMFLHQRLERHMWAGILVIVAGLVMIGVTEGIGLLYADTRLTIISTTAGILFVIAAELFTSIQFVYEHYFVTTRNVSPLAAIGWEGLFGTTIVGLLLIPLYYVRGITYFRDNPQNRVEDILDAFEQMKNNYFIILGMLGFMVCVAFFNVSGLTLSKQRDATTRSVIITVRILAVWPFMIAMHKVCFDPIDFLGLFFQSVGICFYCDIIFSSIIKKWRNYRAPNLRLSETTSLSETTTLLPTRSQATLQANQPKTLRGIIGSVVSGR